MTGWHRHHHRPGLTLPIDTSKGRDFYLATSGNLHLATSGDHFMATDSLVPQWRRIHGRAAHRKTSFGSLG